MPRRRRPITALAIGVYVVYLLVAGVVCTVAQACRTGDSGWRGLSRRPGSAEWFAVNVAGLLVAVCGIALRQAPTRAATVMTLGSRRPALTVVREQ